MSLPLSLPSDLCRIILLEWVEYPGWCKLDSACCNNELRKVLLQQFEEFVPVKLRPFWKLAPYEWFYTRRIALGSLHVNSTFVGKEKKFLNLWYWDRVEELEVGQVFVPDVAVAKLVNSCIRVKSLKVESIKTLTGIDPSIYAQLEVLNIECYDEVVEPSDSIAVAAKRTSRLKSYFSDIQPSVVDVGVHCKILAANPSLERIRITGDLEDCTPILQRIAKSCPKCVSVTLFHKRYEEGFQFQLSDVLKIHKKCPNIDYIHLEHEVDEGSEDSPFLLFCSRGGSRQIQLSRYDDEDDLATYLAGVSVNLAKFVSMELPSSALNSLAAASRLTLRSLEILFCPVDAKALKQLLSWCKNLEAVSLVQNDDPYLSMVELVSVFTVPNKVKTLSISSKYLTAEGMIQIIRAGSSLIKVGFKNIRNDVDLAAVESLATDHVNINGEKLVVSMHRSTAVEDDGNDEDDSSDEDGEVEDVEEDDDADEAEADDDE